MRLASGSVRMRRKSSRVSACSSTRIGRRPCSSGNRSDGLATWNAPEAMNSTWSVFTGPCLVEIVVPSISGSRSRCTPSRETSPPMRPPSRARADLVDLVEEHDAVVLDRMDRLADDRRRRRSACRSPRRSERRRLSATVTRRGLVRWPNALPSMSPMLIAPIEAPGAPGISNIGKPAPGMSATWISISLSLSSPVRRRLRKISRVAGDEPGPTSASSTRSSAFFSARARTSLRFASFTSAIATSTRSRMMLLDVAADVADLGELRRLDLDERRARELGQAARDLRLADAGRADHQDVLRQHLFVEVALQLLAAPAVAQRDGDGALGVVLADDVAVELGDDLAGREVGHRSKVPLLH